jgi:uncharacterized protein (TIGR02646 family)
MKKIEKNAEPREWTEYRLTPGVDYQAIPELRDSLLEEQGYICAYCMRRIPIKDKNSTETSRIDHILSRTKHEDLKLSYQNMVICCPGAIDNDKFHCDKCKGEEDITFNLFDEVFISTISYNSKDGAIKSSNAIYDKEMQGMLNLNHALLQKNRQQTLQGVTAVLNRKQVPWKKSEIRKLLEQWQNKDITGQFKPYCGIVIWYLNKKIC